MNIFDKIRELGLKESGYVVVAGGVLVALGLLEWDEDIDICVTPEVFEALKRQGWQAENWQGKQVLKNGVYDVGVGFWKWNLADLQSDAIWIEKIPFMNPTKLLAWKKHMSRPKDLEHIKLIEGYLKA